MTGDRAPSLRLAGPLAPLSEPELDAPSPDAAVALLGALLVRDVDGRRLVARVVETEAYREDDPASHSHAKRTSRSEPMFWRAGTAYVYRSYGVHWCVNVTVEPADVGAAVLLRAGVLLVGHEAVRDRRPTARRDRDLLRGPGNLARGLAIDGPSHDRIDLLTGDGGLWLATDGWRPADAEVARGPRVGVRHAADVPWRFWVADVPEVSRYVRSPRAAPPPSDPAA